MHCTNFGRQRGLHVATVAVVDRQRAVLVVWLHPGSSIIFDDLFIIDSAG